MNQPDDHPKMLEHGKFIHQSTPFSGDQLRFRRIFASSQAVQIHLAASLHEQQNAAAAGQDGPLGQPIGWGLVDPMVDPSFPSVD